MLEIVKTACSVADMLLDKKLNILDGFYEIRKHSVHMLCEALDVSRGTLYNHIKRGKKCGKSIGRPFYIGSDLAN
jgi:predicted DNA-binding protein YlxM (UPF0122 family)